MMFRRKFLACAPAFTAFPAFAASGAPSVIAAYEKVTGGRIGVYACNLATRQRLTWRENERFALCSTFKVSPVAQASLEAGKMSVRALCQAAIEQSDNACANLLLARVGGPENLTRFWRSLGDQTTRLDDWEPDLNRVPPGSVRNTTTPAAMAGVLEHLLFGEVLSASSRLLLTEWLKGCQTGRNRLRAGFPAGWEVGDKTGTNGQDAAGDCAVAWPSSRTPLIVCVYTRGGHPAEDQFRAAFAGIARLAGQTLAQSSTN